MEAWAAYRKWNGLQTPEPGVMANNSGAGVLSLTYDQMLLEEEQWNELFGNNWVFWRIFKWRVRKIKAENISKTTRIRPTKEFNKIPMRCLYHSNPSKRGYRKWITKIWREIGVFEVTKQRLADQTKMIRTLDHSRSKWN